MKKILYLVLIAVMAVVAESVKATPLSGSGTETDPYIIATTADWTEFCDNHATYKNSYIKMANFVTAATNKYFNDTFSGTFDGDGYTLTVNISGGRVAPFMQVSGTIKNLRVAGSITGSANHTSGLISFCTSNTTCTIQNCIVSATITNNGNLGGFIGHANHATVNLTDCVFNGTLNYSGANNNYYSSNGGNSAKKVGGFVAWEDNNCTINISRCLFDGTINCTAGFTPFIVRWSRTNFNVNGDAASCLYTVDKSDGFPSGMTIFDGTSAIGQTAEQIVTTMNNAGGNGWRVFKGKAEPTTRPCTLGNIPDGWTVTANGDTITVTNGTAIISAGATVVLTPTNTAKVKKVTLVNEGLLNGRFSVSSTKKVQFSQGNLQWSGNNGWRFAENQWTYIGNNANNTTPTASDNNYMDLFCWGATGLNGVAPNTSTTYLTGSDELSGNNDWGANVITNGANKANYGWRTLSGAEWNYLLTTRTTGGTAGATSQARYTMATINTDGTGVNGVILFPDGVNFAASEFTTLGNVNSHSKYTTKCTSAQWTALAAKGCVFLPAAGCRATNYLYPNETGIYCSSSPDPSNGSKAYYVHFFGNNNTSDLMPQVSDNRNKGFLVRLVKDAQ